MCGKEAFSGDLIFVSFYQEKEKVLGGQDKARWPSKYC